MPSTPSNFAANSSGVLGGSSLGAAGGRRLSLILAANTLFESRRCPPSELGVDVATGTGFACGGG